MTGSEVEATVELGQTILPSQHSGDRWSYHILLSAHQRTNRSDYLNEAITSYHDLRKVLVTKAIRFGEGEILLQAVNNTLEFVASQAGL